MQIRLTVVDPLGPSSPVRERAVSCDVLVTAPAGTALAAVASALASAVSGGDGSSGSSGAPVLYAGDQRLDAQRCTLGEPPLIDGAVLAVGAPGEPEPHPELDAAPTRLHVVAGPDAGGVHLLHGGEIRIGRSADADVPLDDPDVSRLHCAVTVGSDGRVSVADLGSTNGTTLDGRPVGARPVRLTPGALLRIGESALRLTPAEGPSARTATTPDGEGHVRVPGPRTARAAQDAVEAPGPRDAGGAPEGPRAPTHHAYGSADRVTPAHADAPTSGPISHVPEQSGPPAAERRDGGSQGQRTVRIATRGDVPRMPQGRRVSRPVPADETHAGRGQAHGLYADPVHGQTRDKAPTAHPGAHPAGPPPVGPTGRTTGDARDGRYADATAAQTADTPDGTRKGTPVRGTDVPEPPRARKRGGIGAWARRLTGGRTERDADAALHDAPPRGAAYAPAPAVPAQPETWPDPATLLLTALGPGPRLWERGPGHPEALAVRLGTADRPAPDGSRLLPVVPVTVGLREVGALGLAGPRERLSGLARAALAQLAALHSPDTLEIVLIAADPSRPPDERTAEWSWLGWLPHLRPGHGQDCRLLLAHDREQAAARADELLRRLADHDHAGAPADAGPFTVVVVDGDPGGADVRDALARLAVEGPRGGVHLLCLAETPAASPASPLTETYEAACAVAPVFRDCGAVALLSGDVATALRLLRVARTGDGSPPGPVGHGTLATVDAVSAAWAERFARALAPLRPDGPAAGPHPRVSAPLPPSARLLDELGLARATPASLMARWADAADDTGALGGRATAVLGAGPRGPVSADLAADGPHLLVEGPSGSGRTELLRAVVASLAAAERPDRLGIVLVDGRGGPVTGSGAAAGAGAGEGLRVCTDVPHVSTHLSADDPVRMREFAQSLSAELKRRAELLGRSDFAEWHTGRELTDRRADQRTPADRLGRSDFAEWHTGRELTDRMVAQRTAANGDLDSPPSATVRLRPGADRRKTQAAPALPRLVVVVDDLDQLVSPALGAPGRPAAGSVMRALEAVARDGERLGVHLVAATAPCPRTAQTEPVKQASLRVALDAPVVGRGPDDPAPGRGRLVRADGPAGRRGSRRPRRC
ncbi:FHA domain-containing protein [Streptomyces sp. E1N211]|uniref:FHA domain-containing protein n=1 Tax=Streptomyces sp. E1N211 TaxID=1851876 RepID=UPI001F4EBB29|nr:FHA domain-containing protein [Streptomyces sp. E1N211]